MKRTVIVRIFGPWLALTLAGCGGLPLVGGGGSNAPLDVPADREAEVARVEARRLEDPQNPYWPYRLAEVHLAEENSVQAESDLRAALALDPRHAASLSLLSKIFWDQGRHEEAIGLLEAARAEAGSLAPELMTALALHYDAIDRPDLADPLVQRVEDHLDWSKEGSAVAYVHLRGETFAQSEPVAKKALDADPKSAVNQNNWGITKLYAGDPEAARKAFLTAIELDPALPGPLYNLAIVDRFYRFDDTSARDWFRKYRELSSEDPDGLAEVLAVEVAGESNLEGEETN